MNPTLSPSSFVFTDPTCGLRAFLVLDDLTLGPAAGGVRTRRYDSDDDALADATKLARAMTLKCALAGLPAGGGKAVVLDHDGLDRPRAFARLGEFIEQLGGRFRTAGDLGTTDEDLAAMAGTTQYVQRDEGRLSGAVARGLLRAVEGCVEVADRGGVAGLTVWIQGCGAIGGATARLLAEAGASVVVADLDAARATNLADAIGATAVSADDLLTRPADILMPCAAGGVLTSGVARRLAVWAVCGGANNVLADPDAEGILGAREILYVPDFVASSGAVIEGIGRTLMGLDDRTALIDRVGETVRDILRDARATGQTSTEVATARARARIAAARG